MWIKQIKLGPDRQGGLFIMISNMSRTLELFIPEKWYLDYEKLLFWIFELKNFLLKECTPLWEVNQAYVSLVIIDNLGYLEEYLDFDFFFKLFWIFELKNFLLKEFTPLWEVNQANVSFVGTDNLGYLE